MKANSQKRYNPYCFYNEIKGNSSLTDFQLYRAKWELFPQYKIVGRMPLNVDIELTTNCNLSCSYCQQSFDKPKSDELPLGLVANILDECIEKGVPALRLNWRGEPTCYLHLVEAITYAKEGGILDVGINTNGTLLTKKLSEGLIKSRLDKIIVSVHENVNRDKLREKLERFQNIKWGYHYDTPHLRIQTLDTLESDLKLWEAYWGDIADHLAIKGELDFEHITEDNIVSDWCCPQLWQRLIIAADGSIIPCCKALKGGNELQEVLGNIKDMSIEEAWHHPRLNAIREMHTYGLSHGTRMCRLCGWRKRELNVEQ